MMYQWTADMIRFMEDASKNSDYFKNLADKLTLYLNGCKNICDAGCGLGQLSEELGKRGFKSTACDISKSAITYIKRQNLKNVEAIECDLDKWTPKEKFDAMIFNYFGSVDKILEISKRCCKGPVIIVKRDYKYHRFSFEKNPIKGHMAITAEEYLSNRGLLFKKDSCDFEFGQPFKNIDDAVKFFEIYSRDEDKSIISRENVLSKLNKSNIEGFEYYLPCRKKSLVLVLEKV